MSTPVRISDDLAEFARREGSIECRTMPEQVEYWAMLGRKFSPLARPLLRIDAFKNGDLHFEDLTHEEKDMFTNEVFLIPSDYSFDPRVTGKVAHSWDEVLDKPIELRPDGTTWIGYYDEQADYNFIPEKQLS